MGEIYIICPLLAIRPEERELTSLGTLDIHRSVDLRGRAHAQDIALGHPDTAEKLCERTRMPLPDEMGDFVNHEVLQFPAKPGILVDDIDLDRLPIPQAGAGRPLEPAVPANVDLFGHGQRSGPWKT